MTKEPRSAIYVGIAATLLIAATKFIAAYFSHSSAMVAEGVHSVVDTADGLLLLFGQYRAARPADDAHPLGHGKELYFWSLIVAILFFALGAGMAFYEGVERLLHPEPITDPTWNYVVLGASAIFTLGSFGVAFAQFRQRLHGLGYWDAFRRSKDPTLFTLVLEDLADMMGLALAFVGIFLARLLGNPYLDGAASVGVGIVLTVVAVLLARESKGLLIGEGASRADQELICAAADADPAVVAVRRPLTMYFGPHSVLVAMDVEFCPDLTTLEIATAVDRMEAHIRRVRPDVSHIYIETESLRKAAATSGADTHTTQYHTC